MSFIIRSAEERDIKDIMTLASQFSLLNLPANEDVIAEKVNRSLRSFSRQTERKQDSEYMFVVEDLERECVIGSSLILAKHGTTESPHIYFQVRKEDRFSRDLGVGFIHQVLRLKQDVDGPTEIGGLLVDRSYRRRPEKLGKQISLIRFLYISMFPNQFERRLLCEFAPPLTRENRSEFWEAIGRRFTGLSYQEADQISQKHKEFIQSLFPDEDIYACLLDTRARQVMGQVSEATRPAQHLLEGLGFKYLNEVDPFDGGPHYAVNTSDVPLIHGATHGELAADTGGAFQKMALVGIMREDRFNGCQSAFDIRDGKLVLPATTRTMLKLEPGDQVSWTPLDYKKRK